MSKPNERKSCQPFLAPIRFFIDLEQLDAEVYGRRSENFGSPGEVNTGTSFRTGPGNRQEYKCPLRTVYFVKNITADLHYETPVGTGGSAAASAFAGISTILASSFFSSALNSITSWKR